MTRDDVMAEYTGDGWDEPDVDGMADEIVRLRDEMDRARALLIDLKRYRDEAERSRLIIQAAQTYLDTGGTYTSWLALRQLLPLSPSSLYATPT